MFVYTIFDKIAEKAGPVYTANNDGVAIRQFNNLFRDNPTMERGDFQLYRLGEYNDRVPSIIAEECVVVDPVVLDDYRKQKEK